ncbi:hypothetical protein L9F63_011639, partial [Diploptera punctata]
QRIAILSILLLKLIGVDTRRFALNCGGHLQWRVLLGVFPGRKLYLRAKRLVSTPTMDHG